MFLLFPLVYVFSFLYYLKGLLHHKPERLFWFVLLGMSCFTTSMSLIYTYGLYDLIGFVKYFKEIAAIATLTYLLFHLEKPFKFHAIDWMVLILFTYCLTYIFIPVGKLEFIEKITVFKSYGIFGLFYFIGRLLPQATLPLNKILYTIIGLTLVAVALQSIEVLMGRHFQTFIGYTDYNQKINLLYPSGSFGLTMTFETDFGLKRFASFFHDPLDFAISLLMALCIALSWISFDKTETISTKIKWLCVAIILWGIYKTFSRAAMVGSVLVLYAYAWYTGRKALLRILYFLIGLTIIGFFVFANYKMKVFVLDTLSFSESSSLGHLIKWISGLDAIIDQPLGMGLGASGLYAFGDGLGIGGESQPIFMGVQTGVITMILYLVIYFYSWHQLAKSWKQLSGAYQFLAFSMLLMCIGFFLPMMTSYFESFLYMSYLHWLFLGVIVNQIVCQKISK